MTRHITLTAAIVLFSVVAKAQAYDSVSISRFVITDNLLGVNWKDTLKAGHLHLYISEEKVIWRKPTKAPPRELGVVPPIFAVTERIQKNGTEDVAKCFIPRHSVNYYKQGKLVRYLLICFECDGVRFSDDPPKPFIKNAIHRETQMIELKKIFKEIL